MATSIRKIIHIDMDAFFASVEQRDNPQLKDKPVAVGGARKRGVVAAASYEARQFGVYSAMPSVTALKKCPQLIFVPPRFDVYKSVSAEIHKIFAQYTDLIEPLSLDEAYLDVTQCKKPFETATEIAREIKAKIKATTGLTASAGVSFNKFLAKVASDYRKPDGIYVIPPQNAQAFIDQLEIDEFFGVGKVTSRKMKKLGIFHGRDLKQWSLIELTELFGKSGQYFFDIANGQDNRPVQAHRVRKSVGAEQTFADNLHTLEQMRQSLSEITRELARRMQKVGKGGRTITLKIKFSDFKQITRSKTLVESVSQYEAIWPVVIELIENNFTPGKPVRLLGLGLSNLGNSDPDSEQMKLGL